MSNLVTIKQAIALAAIGYNKPTIRYAYDFDGELKLQKDIRYINAKLVKLILPIPTVDEVIDWFRCKHHVIIYNSIEPFVDPIDNRIKYGYRVKKCDVRWGWNSRMYIGNRILSYDINSAKRKAISVAISYIKKQKQYAKSRTNRKNR